MLITGMWHGRDIVGKLNEKEGKVYNCFIIEDILMIDESGNTFPQPFIKPFRSVLFMNDHKGESKKFDILLSEVVFQKTIKEMRLFNEREAEYILSEYEAMTGDKVIDETPSKLIL